MALLELPGKAPSLKLILALLEQTSDVAVDWLLVHLASRELSTYLESDPNSITCKAVFLCSRTSRPCVRQSVLM